MNALKVLSVVNGTLLRAIEANMTIPKRFIKKHYIPKWRRDRGKKFLKVILPDYQGAENLQKMTPGEIRAVQKALGVVNPHRTETAINLTESSVVFDPTVPEPSSFVSTAKAKSVKKVSKMRKMRKIRGMVEEFTEDTFLQEALDIYVEANNLLTKVFPRGPYAEWRKSEDDLAQLHNLVTEYAWPKMTKGLETGTLIWKFIESIEPPEVITVAEQSVKAPDNWFAQITVRLHTRQMFKLYDRFGRLVMGSDEPRDTLEYVVFERRISDSEGRWRLHGKINPTWKKRNMPIQLSTHEIMEEKESLADYSDEKDMEAMKHVV